MEQSVRAAEKEFTRKMVQLNSNFEVRYQVSLIASLFDYWYTRRKSVSSSLAWRARSAKWAGRQYGSVSVPLEWSAIYRPLVGEQLEAVHSSRQRAQTAHDLLDYYIQFSRDDTTRLDALKKDGGKEGRERVAVILRRLSTMAKEVDIPVAEKVRTQNRHLQK